MNGVLYQETLYGKMDKKNICFKKDDVCFNFRVSCIIRKENKFLLHRKTDDKFWNLAGGRVWLGESSIDAIKREIKEELGCNCQITDLTNVCENFFHVDNTSYHEMLMIFSGELENDICMENIEDGLEFRWFGIDEIESLNIKPLFTKKILLGDKKERGWIVNNELSVCDMADHTPFR